MEENNAKSDTGVPPKPAVETYTGDMAEVLENDREGLIKKIISEEEVRENEKKNLSPESRQNKILLIASSVLFLVGLGILLYFFMQRGPKAMEIASEFAPLIFTEKSSFLEIAGLKKQEIINSIVNQARDPAVSAGGIEGIYITSGKKVIGLRQFLTVLSFQFVPGDDPVFVSDNFLLGVVKKNAGTEINSGLFVLLKTRTASDIFGPMRAWEGKMYTDFAPLFGLEISNNLLSAKNFEDSLIENKNTRVLFGEDGEAVLLYVFADNNSVVITDSTEAAREIIRRLSAKEKKE